MRVTVLLPIAVLSAALVGQSTLEPTRREILDFGGASHQSRLDDAAEAGLAWLARAQEPEGFWNGHVGHKQGNDYRVFAFADTQRARGHGHVGVTSLAGLAFLAGGHLPGRGPYGDNVRRALDYLLAHTEENGYITDGGPGDNGTRMYSHAFATLFLAQIHGMIGEPRIKTGLERAVHWIVDCQNHQGGWRYNPFTPEADLSVTVCQLQALRSARNIGIKVPKSTIDRAVQYVLDSRTTGGRGKGLFFYKIKFRGAYQKNQQYAINAAAVTSLFSAGVHERDLMEPALAFLEQQYPYEVRYYRHHFYYWYGNYYACQAFFQAGGAQFERYHLRISRDLLEDQASDGSWHNDTGPGDVFSTAVASMILLVPRQYLPIFQR